MLIMYNLREYSDDYEKYKEVCKNITEMNQVIIQKIVHHLNLNQDLLIKLIKWVP